MTRKPIMLQAALWFALFTLTAGAQAAQFDEFGDYVVHYSTIQTDFLSAKVANDFGIKRSRNRVMLSVMVQHRSGEGHRAVRANVSASATNLTGQLKTIEMRPAQEGTAIYYIGELGVEDEEVLDFTVRVQVEGQTRPFTLSFREQFFTR